MDTMTAYCLQLNAATISPTFVYLSTGMRYSPIRRILIEAILPFWKNNLCRRLLSTICHKSHDAEFQKSQPLQETRDQFGLQMRQAARSRPT